MKFYREVKMNSKEVQQKKYKKKKIILNILLIIVILSLLLAILLYIFEIKKLIPSILILILSSLLSLGIYFLSRSILKQQKRPKRKVIIRKNA